VLAVYFVDLVVGKVKMSRYTRDAVGTAGKRQHNRCDEQQDQWTEAVGDPPRHGDVCASWCPAFTIDRAHGQMMQSGRCEVPTRWLMSGG
jgi:hypothetical protein